MTVPETCNARPVGRIPVSCHASHDGGTPTRLLYPTVFQLVRGPWDARSEVVDATGVGGGLAAYLGAALVPSVVTPYVYTAASKSELAYSLLGALNDGRLALLWRDVCGPVLQGSRPCRSS